MRAEPWSTGKHIHSYTSTHNEGQVSSHGSIRGFSPASSAREVFCWFVGMRVPHNMTLILPRSEMACPPKGLASCPRQVRINDNSLSHLLSLQDTFLHRTEEPQKSQSRRQRFPLAYRQVLALVHLDKHPDKTFIGRIEKGFERSSRVGSRGSCGITGCLSPSRRASDRLCPPLSPWSFLCLPLPLSPWSL